MRLLQLTLSLVAFSRMVLSQDATTASFDYPAQCESTDVTAGGTEPICWICPEGQFSNDSTNVTIGPTTLTCEIWSTAGICGLLPDETQACALVKLVTADCACVPLPDIQSPTESPVATTIVGDRDNIFQESQRVADSASMFVAPSSWTVALIVAASCGLLL